MNGCVCEGVGQRTNQRVCGRVVERISALKCEPLHGNKQWLLQSNMNAVSDQRTTNMLRRSKAPNCESVVAGTWHSSAGPQRIKPACECSPSAATWTDGQPSGQPRNSASQAEIYVFTIAAQSPLSRHSVAIQSPYSRHTVAIQSPYSRHWKKPRHLTIAVSRRLALKS